MGTVFGLVLAVWWGALFLGCLGMVRQGWYEVTQYRSPKGVAWCAIGALVGLFALGKCMGALGLLGA
jgi:hypothetical protein